MATILYSFSHPTSIYLDHPHLEEDSELGLSEDITI